VIGDGAGELLLLFGAFEVFSDEFQMIFQPAPCCGANVKLVVPWLGIGNVKLTRQNLLHRIAPPSGPGSSAKKLADARNAKTAGATISNARRMPARKNAGKQTTQNPEVSPSQPTTSSIRKQKYLKLNYR